MTAVQIELSEFLRWLEPTLVPDTGDEFEEWDVQRLLRADTGTVLARPRSAYPKVQARRPGS